LSLLSEGITAMKIWPFDMAAEASDGQYISNADLDTALEPFRKIRSAVGEQMDIMVEFHSLWRLPMAQKIARALRQFNTFWHEDAIRMDSLDLLRQYAKDCEALVCASETLSYKWGFKDYLQTGVAGVVMLDLSWCGGLSEAREIAAMADAWQLPVAPHDCTGPVVWAASSHLSLHAPNALVQESVRAFYSGWYKELVTELPRVHQGMLSLGDKPGLGLELLPDLHLRKDAVVRFFQHQRKLSHEDHRDRTLHPARAGHRWRDRRQHPPHFALGRGGRAGPCREWIHWLRLYRYPCAPAQRPLDRALDRRLRGAAAGGRGRQGHRAPVAEGGAQSGAAVGGPGGRGDPGPRGSRCGFVGPPGQGRTGAALEAAGWPGP
jgi:hypothetical protein